MTRGAVYVNITAEDAKGIMDTQEGCIILDVRTQERALLGSKFRNTQIALLLENNATYPSFSPTGLAFLTTH